MVDLNIYNNYPNNEQSKETGMGKYDLIIQYKDKERIVLKKDKRLNRWRQRGKERG